ncbi:MAG: hypothetical protein ACN6NT_10800 [Comamonas sp.]
MTPNHAPIAAHATLPGDALCAQAAIVLRVTAQQWGMCTKQRPSAARTPAARKREVASKCAQLLQAWHMTA